MISASAFAQTASQITPQSFRPNLERSGGFVLPGAAGLATPAGAEKLFVSLSGVTIKGGLPALADAGEALRKRLMGRRITGADLFAAARDLEAEYAKAGYVLVRVVLPPQTLNDGSRLTLLVIDGFIESVETKDVPERVRNRIRTLVEPLIGRRSLMLAEIERRVLLAGDTPGVVLRSTLSPGKAQGATVLIVDASYQPVSETLTFDNTLSKALGRTTLGAGLDFNSVAGFGELVYLRANGHPDGGSNGFFERYPRNRTLAAGLVLPLWIDGLSFNAEGTTSRISPVATGGLQTTDSFERLSLRLRYAWLRGRSANFNTEVTLDVQNERLDLLLPDTAVPLSLDRVRIVRFVGEGDVITPWGATITGRGAASFGLDALGARSAADATPLLPLSRQGADATFQKVDVAVTYLHAVADHVTLSAAARAQTSFNQALVRSEQIGIANTSGVSAFDTGTVVGDQGYVVRGEIQSPWTLPKQDNNPLAVIAAPYLFGAFGEVSFQNPTALESSAIRATSYGIGLRLFGLLPNTLSNGSLTLEASRGHRSDFARETSRLTIVSAFRF